MSFVINTCVNVGSETEGKTVRAVFTLPTVLRHPSVAANMETRVMSHVAHSLLSLKKEIKKMEMSRDISAKDSRLWTFPQTPCLFIYI